MSKPTPKFPLPWKATRVLVMSGMCHAFVRAANDETVCRVDVHGESPEAETRCRTNAARIAACVNGLEGIEDPEDILRDMEHCQERVVNLLVAARAMVDAFAIPKDGSRDDTVEPWFSDPLKMLRAAIALEEKEGKS